MNLNNFKYQDYIFMYKDLNHYSKKGALHHYIKYGFKEGRKCFLTEEERDIYYNYNWIKYRNDYNDLCNFDLKQLWIHWITNGKNENRYIKKINFDYKFYLEHNQDLIENGINNRMHTAKKMCLIICIFFDTGLKRAKIKIRI